MEAANNERIKAVSLSNLLVDSCVSSYQLHLPFLYILTKVWITRGKSKHSRKVSSDCVNDEITKGEDVQLGGVVRVFVLTLRGHVVEVPRIGSQLGDH